MNLFSWMVWGRDLILFFSICLVHCPNTTTECILSLLTGMLPLALTIFPQTQGPVSWSPAPFYFLIYFYLTIAFITWNPGPHTCWASALPLIYITSILLFWCWFGHRASLVVLCDFLAVFSNYLEHPQFFALWYLEWGLSVPLMWMTSLSLHFLSSVLCILVLQWLRVKQWTWCWHQGLSTQ
jgi:hypothetical protein